MSFYNKYNLINATKEDIVAENTVLFSVEYSFINPKDREMIFNIIKFIEKCKKGKGLFDPFPNAEGTKDQYMSHDNLTAFVAMSKKHNWKYHKEIWNYLVKHFFTYDNISGKVNFKRFMHPRDILFYGYCADNVICKLLYPLLVMFMVITCAQSYKVRNGNKILKTDGILLSWVRCKGANLDFSLKILTFIIKCNKNFKTWKNVFSIYFKDIEHPIRKLLK